MSLFNTWRSEITAELSETRAEFATASAEVVAATETASAAKRELRDLTAAFEHVARRGTIATALTTRREQREAELRNAEGRLTCARIALTTARARIADLSEALEQLSMMAPAEVSEAEPEAEPEPQPVPATKKEKRR